jgi:hypothetical protein
MGETGSALEMKDVTQANSSVLEEPPPGGSSFLSRAIISSWNY